MPNSPLIEVVVDLDAIARNVRQFGRIAAPAEVMVVLKADAYNHGLGPVLRTVRAAGVRHVGVATLQEALAVRTEAAGGSLDVLAWMWHPGQDLLEAFDADITIGVPSLSHARALIAAAKAYVNSCDVTPVRATLIADTGLSRSGVSPAEWEETVALLSEHRDLITVTGLMSHLSSADDATDPATDRQAARFAAAIDYCRARGLDMSRNHLANTPATLNRPDLHHELVRPGVGVYGVNPLFPAHSVTDSDSTPVELRGAMTLRAQVITTRVVPAGEGVSYGHTWVAPEDTRTAVVAIGYADGLPRSVSGSLEVSINGRRYQQIGRVCMDQIVVSLGPAAEEDPGVRPGDWAVIFGDDGLSLDEFAELADTIAYEVMTMPRGARMTRRYVGGGAHGTQSTDASDSTADSNPGESSGEGIDLARTTGTATAATADEMRALGRQLGDQLSAGTVVVLAGPLGAGKTTITQGIAEGLGVKGRVQSPTFTIVRTHASGTGDDSTPGMLHMDAYRLLGADVQEGIEPGRYIDRNEILDALESLDIDADLDRVVVVAEWGRGVVEELSDSVLDVEIDRTGLVQGDPEDSANLEDLEDSDFDPEVDPRVVTWTWVSRQD